MKNPATPLTALCFLLLQFTPMPLAHAADQVKPPVRNMMGAYKEANAEDERLMTVANFALTTFLSGKSTRVYSFSTSLLQLGGSEGGAEAEDNGSGGGDVSVKIMEAHQQVVAGMNYKLTLGVFQGEDCLGAFKVTVYDRFGDMSVTDWGEEVPCEDVQDSEEETS